MERSSLDSEWIRTKHTFSRSNCLILKTISDAELRSANPFRRFDPDPRLQQNPHQNHPLIAVNTALSTHGGGGCNTPITGQNGEDAANRKQNSDTNLETRIGRQFGGAESVKAE
jgi:hypothetical protein